MLSNLLQKNIGIHWETVVQIPKMKYFQFNGKEGGDITLSAHMSCIHINTNTKDNLKEKERKIK